MQQKQNIKNSLTWNELADLYDKEHNSRKSRTLPMSEVFQWAEQQTDKFGVDDEGLIYLKEV